MSPEHHPVPATALLLKRVESIVLFSIAVVLVVLAVLLLISSAIALVQDLSQIRDSAIEILDSVLLVMMTMEIVYTVTLSIESHTLVAEPFLIVGAIRRHPAHARHHRRKHQDRINEPGSFPQQLDRIGFAGGDDHRHRRIDLYPKAKSALSIE